MDPVQVVNESNNTRKKRKGNLLTSEDFRKDHNPGLWRAEDVNKQPVLKSMSEMTNEELTTIDTFCDSRIAFFHQRSLIFMGKKDEIALELEARKPTKVTKKSLTTQIA